MICMGKPVGTVLESREKRTDLFWMSFQHRLVGDFLQLPPCMIAVDFLLRFPPGQSEGVGVGHHDIIAAVSYGRDYGSVLHLAQTVQQEGGMERTCRIINGFVFAHEQESDARSGFAQNLVLQVDMVPCSGVSC